MRKEIEEYITDFNTYLQNCQIKYSTNGFWESLSLSDLGLEVYNTDNVRKKINTRLFMIAEELQMQTEKILIEEVDKFVEKCKNEIKVILPNMNFSFYRISSLSWKLVLIGTYDDNCNDLSNLLNKLEDDFTKCFDYAKLHIE